MHNQQRTKGISMSEHPLWILITVATIGSAALVLVAGMALLRRRTWSYLFITVAIGMLLVRSLVGFLALGGPIHGETHHMLEHLFDVMAIVLLFAAIYTARTIQPTHEPENLPHNEK